MACAEVRALVPRPCRGELRLFPLGPGDTRRNHNPPRRGNRPRLLVAGRRRRPRPSRPWAVANQGCSGLPRRRAERATRRPRRESVWRSCLCPRHGARRHGACPRRATAAPRRNDQIYRRGRPPSRRKKPDRDHPRRQLPGHCRDGRDGCRSGRRGGAKPRRLGRCRCDQSASRKRRGGCCSSPRSIGPSAPLHHQIQRLV